ncbi:MAG: DUF4169 family protein [Sphingomonadaceae bacterium]
MAEIINLRRARKIKARAEAASTADANRAKHGRTKAQKALDAADAQRQAWHLDQHRRDPD